jgi:MFS family permease
VLAGAFSLFTLVHGISGAPIGWLCDRVGPRRLVAAGGTVMALGLALDSTAAAPWHLYLAFGVLTSLGVSATGWTPAVVLVQRWFPQRVGPALGLTSAGLGVGIVVVVPLCQHLVGLAGWRWAFRARGAVLAARRAHALRRLRQPDAARPPGRVPRRPRDPRAHGRVGRRAGRRGVDRRQGRNALGGSAGPWVGGLVFDATGSYAGAFGAAVLAAALATAALWLAAPRRGPR